MARARVRIVGVTLTLSSDARDRISLSLAPTEGEAWPWWPAGFSRVLGDLWEANDLWVEMNAEDWPVVGEAVATNAVVEICV
jgi:hypothetical protein